MLCVEFIVWAKAGASAVSTLALGWQVLFWVGIGVGLAPFVVLTGQIARKLVDRE